MYPLCTHRSLSAAQLEREQRERSRVGHGISSLQKDMVRLNTLITEKRGHQERLQQDNALLQSDFVLKLKVHAWCVSMEFTVLQNTSVKHRHNTSIC